MTQNKRSQRMESAASILAVISLVSCTCLYVSIICGALAIILAMLSKGGATSMSRRAVIAVIIGALGLVLTTVLYVTSFVSMLQTYGSIEGILKAYSDMTGLDYDTLMQMYQQ